MPAHPAIAVRGLTKVFRVPERPPGVVGALRQLIRPATREVVAVKDVSFEVAPGERVAFVGPNGAGKSTTIKVLSGILLADAGDVQVAGLVPWNARTKLGYRIGTVFGQRSQLWYHLPARDSFDLLSHIYELDRAEYTRRCDALVDVFELGALLDRPVRQLSLGQRMRCELVASLLHKPRVLFLDEPTIGLDVTAKALIRDLVKERSTSEGTTVLLTSHDTGDMERVCDRVIVIHEGRLLLDQAVADLRKTFIRKRVVTLLTAEPTLDVSLPGARIVHREPHQVVLAVDTQKTPVAQVVAYALEHARLRDVTIEDPPMEDIVKAIYAGAAS